MTAASRTVLSWSVGVALVLGAATQLRLGMVGPGEFMLGGLWLAAIVTILSRAAPSESVPLQVNYMAVLLTVACWSWVGLAVSQYQGTTYEGWLRQLVALLLAISFPLVVFRAWGKEVFIRAMGAMSVFALVAYFIVWAATIFGVSSLGAVEFIKFEYRFVGFSSDPNQAVMLISVAMLSAVIVGLKLAWPLWKIGILLLMAVVLGRATDSDSFFVGFGLALLIALWEIGIDRQRRLRPIAILIISVVGIIGISLVLYGIYADFQDLYEKNSQGAVRMRLWTHGLEALFAAPLTGHGPGHFSGWLAVFGDFEAHNLYVDWAAQFGLVGLLVLVILLFRLGIQLARAREFSGLAMLAILMILSMFLFFGRHAVFWSGFFLCLVLLGTNREERAR